VHDVSVREGSVLTTQEARVLLVHEEAEVRAEAAVLVAHPLRERRMRTHQRLERLAQRRGVKCDVARSARESAVGAVEQYPHLSTTNGSGQDGHRLARRAVEAPLEQRALGGVLGQLERARVGRARVRRSAKRAEELSASRVEQVVAAQLP